MKKMVALFMLVLFVACFVVGTFVSTANALPPDTYQCIDGRLWVCTWDYIGNGNNIKIVQNCHWNGPC